MSFFEYHHLKALTENKNIKNHFRLSNVESEFRIICELKHEQFSIYVNNYEQYNTFTLISILCP